MNENNRNWQYSLGKFCIGLMFVSGLQGCESMARMARTPEGKALVCGGGGLLTGAALGAGCYYLTGSKGGCAVLGVASALADGYYCWWKLSEKIIEDYDQTVEALKYSPSQGYVVKILDFSAEPKVVHPGENVNIRVKYALMSPNSTDEIKYERSLTLPGDNKPRTQLVTHQPGTWGTDGDYSFPIDPKASDGKVEMTLEIKLSEYGKQDRRTLCFNVTRQGQPESSQLCPAETKSVAKKSRVLVVSNVKQYATVCIEPNNNCKKSNKKQFLGIANLNEQLPVVDDVMHDSKLWYKIRLKDGREGWLHATTGKLVEE
jgi:hypothetical protein